MPVALAGSDDVNNLIVPCYEAPVSPRRGFFVIAVTTIPVWPLPQRKQTSPLAPILHGRTVL